MYQVVSGGQRAKSAGAFAAPLRVNPHPIEFSLTELPVKPEIPPAEGLEFPEQIIHLGLPIAETRGPAVLVVALNDRLVFRDAEPRLELVQLLVYEMATTSRMDHLPGASGLQQLLTRQPSDEPPHLAE
jgi:hypothetical protein